MLRKSDFWAGALVGVVGIYAYQWYRTRKMSSGS